MFAAVAFQCGEFYLRSSTRSVGRDEMSGLSELSLRGLAFYMIDGIRVGPAGFQFARVGHGELVRTGISVIFRSFIGCELLPFRFVDAAYRQPEDHRNGNQQPVGRGYAERGATE